ncbi:MAG: CBO0543 family protein [Syntrophomonas sp.]
MEVNNILIMIYKSILGAAHNSLFDQYLSAKQYMFELRTEHWLKHEILSAQWFGIIIGTVIFILIWWRLLDKKRLVEILLFGFFIAATSSILDGVGTEINAWDYPYKIGPMLFPLVAVDLLMLPYIFMLLYQYFAKWKDYLVALTITSAVFCFIVEPILKYTGIYELYTWKYYYSFPIYILLGLFYKWLMQVIICRQKRERN